MVLDRRARWVKLRGNRSLRDILIMGRKRVATKAERTDPNAGSNVDIAVDCLDRQSKDREPVAGDTAAHTHKG